MADSAFLPVLIIPGLRQARLFLTDEAGNRLKSAWPPALDSEALVSALKGPLMKMLMFRRDAGFSDKVAALVREMADPVATTPEGRMKHKTDVPRYPCLAACTPEQKRELTQFTPAARLAARIGEENVFFFSYNPFGDPCEIAEELNDTVRKIKADRGCRQVNLLFASLGGVIADAYFDAFGRQGDIARAVFLAAALEGSSLIAELLQKDVRPEGFASILTLLTDEKTAGSLQSLSRMLPEGVPGALADKALTALAETVLLGSPMIWAMTPPEAYPELAARYLGGPAHAALRQKTARSFAARSNVRALFPELQANGTEFYLLAGYGLPFPAFSRSGAVSSDGMIGLSSAALGAKGAAPGETLPDNEIGDRGFLAPGGDADASFGTFPRSTWFFEKQAHGAIAYNDKALAVIERALSDPDFHDIFSDPSLPQFCPAQDTRVSDADV